MAQKKRVRNAHTKRAGRSSVAEKVETVKISTTKTVRLGDESQRDTPCEMTERSGQGAMSTRNKVHFEVLNGSQSVMGRRERNEDFCLMDQDRHIWVVSDGIGGAPFGDVMSRIACNATPLAWDSTQHIKNMPDRMRATINRIDETASSVSVLLGNEGSGATYLLAAFDGNHLWTAAVGDTRAYLMRNSKIQRIGGKGQPSTHSNILDSAIGYHLDLNPDINATEVRDNDVIILCSDGVWATQTEPQMVSALLADMNPTHLSGVANPQQMARMVVSGADMSDNATAVVLLFEGHQTNVYQNIYSYGAQTDPSSTAEVPLIPRDT